MKRFIRSLTGQPYAGSPNSPKIRPAGKLGLSVVIAGLLLTGASCKKNRPSVVNSKNSTDFGLANLRLAADEASKHQTDPAAFFAFYSKIKALEPGFDERTRKESQRALAFLAIYPMANVSTKTPQEQLNILSTTVWPAVFDVMPEPNETPKGYLVRVCGSSLAVQCKHTVPESWPILLNAYAWRTMKSRAREAYVFCDSCQLDPSYTERLSEYDKFDTEWQTRKAKLGDRQSPSFWPQAWQHAEPWQETVWLDLAGESPRWNDEPISDWRGHLAQLQPTPVSVGLHLHPKQTFAFAKDALLSLTKLGIKDVRLQSRSREYPYATAAYTAVKQGKLVEKDLRDIDTVQVLVQRLDSRNVPVKPAENPVKTGD